MSDLTRSVRTAMGWHRPLMWYAVAMAVLGVISAAGLVFDDRVLTGEPIWTKSLKFCISLALYAVTWSWMYGYLPKGRRLAWWGGTVFAIAGFTEMVVIVVQIARGVRSHFNLTSPLNNALFQVMTVSAVLLLVSHLALGVVLIRGGHADRLVTSAIRAAMAIAALGMVLAVLMTGSLPSQRRVNGPGFTGGHTLGMTDGGPGLPIVGWSTVGGDLRIPHFVGLHAMQVLPFVAMALAFGARRLPRLADRLTRLRLMRTASAGYLGLVALVTWQALRGQSIVRPDALTLLAAGGLAAAVALAATLTLRTSSTDSSDTAAKGLVISR